MSARRHSRNELIELIEKAAKRIEVPKDPENIALCMEREGFQIVKFNLQRGVFRNGNIEWSMASEANWSFSPKCPQEDRIAQLHKMVSEMYERLQNAPRNMSDDALMALAKSLGAVGS